jgi:hypothetical protein
LFGAKVKAILITGCITTQILQMKNIASFFLIIVFITSCTSQKTITLRTNSSLKFIGEYDLAHNDIFQNTTVGGLSGIDYDAKHDLYYLICDDRSSFNPARFYTAKIYLNEKGIDSVRLIAVKDLLQPNGMVYPNSKQDSFHTPDPEAMRYNSNTGRLVWSSEGERIVKGDTVVLEDPSVNTISINGNYIDSFVLPPNMHMQSIEKGPRQNGVFEGLTFTNHYKKLLVSVEEPLYEDGPRAGLNDSSAWIRLIQYDVKTRSPEAQYAYQIDPVAYPAVPANAFKINGVPDILAINDHQLLVIERSFSTGRKPSTIKVYLADRSAATDVSSIASLKNARFAPVKKKLLLNMDSLGIYIDNVEGVSLGPRLPNGHPTLLFVADNNFSADEVTQFLLFEVQ